jgi:hypothetical protein
LSQARRFTIAGTDGNKHEFLITKDKQVDVR